MSIAYEDDDKILYNNLDGTQSIRYKWKKCPMSAEEIEKRISGYNMCDDCKNSLRRGAKVIGCDHKRKDKLAEEDLQTFGETKKS